MRSILSILLGLTLFVNPSITLAHAGHGDEFKNDANTLPNEGVQVDTVIAEKIGIKIEPVTKKSLAIAIRATGQIELLPNGRAKVTTPIKGTVISLMVEPGATVQAGQVVATLSSPELTDLRVTSLEKQAEAGANVQEAIANLELARQNYARQQQIVEVDLRQAEIELNIDQERYVRDRELLETGAISRRLFQESESKLAVAKSSLAKASSRLPLLEAEAQVKRASAILEAAQSRVALSSAAYDARLRQLASNADPDGTIAIAAPISGTVLEREASIGESVDAAGKPLMTIVDDRTVLATANIYEKDLGRIRVGQQINLKVAGLPPNTKFQGKITVIGAVVSGETRVIPVKAEIINLKGQLKSGMFAELEVLTDKASTPVLAVPSLAVVEVQGKNVIYVQNGNVFQPTEVKLGQTSGDLVEIETGLFEGDRIVTQGAPLLYAQSLRGGSKKEEQNSQTETKQVLANNAIAVPWWSFPLGGGIFGVAIWGTYWLGRRGKEKEGRSIRKIS
jgi:membrane fusion protein, heavy metal efflux system